MTRIQAALSHAALLLFLFGAIECGQIAYARADVLRGIEIETLTFLRRLLNGEGRQVTKWEFENVTLIGAQRMSKYLPLFIPGNRPEVTLLLDRTNFTGAIQTMERAWGQPIADFPHSANVDAYLSSKSGKTVVVIGHIEGDSFAFTVEGGGPARLTLSDLQARAIQNNVFLIPIGCDSRTAGAFIGTKRNVTTDEVAQVLRSIQSVNLSLSQLLESFKPLGPLVMNVDSANRMLLFSTLNPLTGAATSFKLPVQMMAAKLPWTTRVVDLLASPLEVLSHFLDWLTSSFLISAVALVGPGAFSTTVAVLLRKLDKLDKLSDRFVTTTIIVVLAWTWIIGLFIGLKVHELYHDFARTESSIEASYLRSIGEQSLAIWAREALAFHYIELVSAIAASLYIIGLLFLLIRRFLSRRIRRDIDWIIRVIRAGEIAIMSLALCFGGLFGLAATFGHASIWWTILVAAGAPLAIVIYQGLDRGLLENILAEPSVKEEISDEPVATVH
jgi:hypothetical protein